MAKEHELDQAFLMWLKYANDFSLKLCAIQTGQRWRKIACIRELKKRGIEWMLEE